ncbi:helix-turn-helix transcriptional regulator [Nocardia sp. CDC153]|uniref:helix-turn-helix domain-containing protein n=1 Tax=Nocardia sp. CDC153 TaxID=3112167 RepID=UPI002DB7E694|nr:helix-turn-helix transcriptional regulator [Nocardia sp. CDC153]MEC3957145.1 helix-turn-helix transcriptional regulator [Nocardia sp. CDC153]
MAEHPRLTAIPGGLDETGRGERRGVAPARDAGVAPAREVSGRERPGSVRPDAGREPLWREALGAQLRSRRLELGEKLTETAGRAGISPQYLSEVERGRKEPSSEMIAALAGALGTSLSGLTLRVAEELRNRQLASFTRTAAPQRYSGQAMLSLAA